MEKTQLYQAGRAGAPAAGPALNNRYFICLPGRPKPVPWDPLVQKEGPAECASYFRAAASGHFTFTYPYFSNVFEAVERRLQQGGLTFYFTRSVEELPSYGRDVVAVVEGDELSRFPRYADRVLAIFKCFGTRATLGLDLRGGFSHLGALTLLKYTRTEAHRLGSVLRYRRQRVRAAWKGGPVAPIFPIPLGYANQRSLPIKPFQERQYDVFFAGSVRHLPHRFSPAQRWVRTVLRTPKELSREQMVSALKQMEQHRPELKVRLVLTEDYTLSILNAGQAGAPSPLLDAEAYSSCLMDTKICVVPRGSSFETFRFFEAMRYGCLLVTEALPSRWFYDGAPVLRVSNWKKELEDVIVRTLRDEEASAALHEQTLQWWRTKCSEEAVGAYLAEKVDAVRTNGLGATGEPPGP